MREAVSLEVDSQVLKILHDYHLLEDGAPTAKYVMHEITRELTSK